MLRMFDRAALVAVVALLAAELASMPPVEPPPAPVAYVYMTVPQYAAHIQVSTRTCRRLLADGLPAVRPRPRMVRIPVAAADAWLAARARSATVAAVQGAMS